ncbi:hypothetical protein [Pseudomaricurvus sp.]|uniref:hypothetical protein n=1 Tax=Pseudomaricurvus sp. TaxID=2004510 RepID=UPI003F6BE0FD
MAQYKMVVLSNPVAGREKECDDWYRNQHLHDVVRLPGFISAQRFQLANPVAQERPYQFMAVYEIDTEDLERTLSGLVNAAEVGELEVSSALDRANSYAVVYAEDGEPVTELTAIES